MSEKTLFTQEDCLKTGYDISIDGKVIVLKASALPESLREAKHQLYFCTGGNGSNPNPIGRSIFTVSLADGEKVRWNRSDVLGILKHELLPDHARLQLSQIRPNGALDLKSNEPQYSGYCFLQDGRYTSGVWLCSAKEVQDYIEMQKDYQHRVMICDRDDFCVFEMIEGKLIHPSPEAMEALRKEHQEQGGMELKL
ncbi:MAG: hypothetical protein ACYCYE_16040 [Clostridia bacterium]|nr:MAG: hypothetical protein C4550_05060 [Nitrospiraceae bacterium]